MFAKLFAVCLLVEDFDSEKDKKLLEAYVSEYKTDKGITFPRHRVVTVARKKGLVK